MGLTSRQFTHLRRQYINTYKEDIRLWLYK